MKRIYLAYLLGIFFLVNSSCQNQKKHKEYLYVSKKVFQTINTTYDEYGYPEDYSWAKGKDIYNSYIYLNLKKNKVTVVTNNVMESFDIKESWNEDMLFDGTFTFYANDNKNESCMMAISKVPTFGLSFLIFRPYRVGKLYQVEYVDPELLFDELKKEFNTIPRN